MHTKQQKRKLRRFLHAKEITMITLAMVSLCLLIAEHLVSLSQPQLLQIERFDIAVGCIFLGEFLFELYFANNRRLYMRRHWFYLIASVPLPLQSFEALRGIRLLRLLRLLKIFAHLRYEENTRLFDAGK